MQVKNYSYTDFRNIVTSGFSHYPSRDGDVYVGADVAYKIYDQYMPPKNKREFRVEDIALLDEKFLTIPISKLYIDDVYSGFEMFNGGESLKSYLFKYSVSFDETINILNQLKDIIIYLSDNSLVHADVRLSNILYKNGHVRLTDVNGILFNGDIPLPYSFVPLFQNWYIVDGSVKMLDVLAFNLWTYILLNNSVQDTRKDVIYNIEFFLDDLRSVLDKDSGMFDNEVTSIVKNAILGDHSAIKELKPNTFLIDYLK
ncbi:MAG: hypothetical protein J1F35_01160 [Erysipelotrichales bacterium]|nr:hypothetical protein [Erysipelotrichales bacterium]